MKVLLIHPFGIGDVVFSLAAAEALTRRGHRVSYLCNERTEEFLRLCPVVHKTHRFDRSDLRGLIRSGDWLKAAARYNALRREIAAEGYGAALDFSMGREYAFLAMCSGIGRRVGLDYKGRGWCLTGRVRVESFDDRSPRDYAMDLARILDAEVGTEPKYPDMGWRGRPAQGLAEANRWAGEKMGQRRWVVIAPGGGESWGADAHYKQWPEASWIRLTQLLARDTGMVVAVVGSQAEQALVRAVCAAAEPHSAAGVIPVIGESLSRVLALLAGAAVFVGTDGGLLHLANAAGTPVVGLYGPVSEKGYGPLESAGPARVLTSDAACRPCYRKFRFTGCGFDKACLTRIPPDRVGKEVRALLASNPLC